MKRGRHVIARCDSRKRTPTAGEEGREEWEELGIGTDDETLTDDYMYIKIKETRKGQNLSSRTRLCVQFRTGRRYNEGICLLYFYMVFDWFCRAH